MSIAFWSIKIVGNKPVEVQPPEGYVVNVQQAALANGKDKTSYVVSVDTLAIEGEKLSAVIGTLRTTTVEQFNCNLVFGYDVPTKFSVASNDNNGAVYLSGYFQPAPEDGEGEGDEDGKFNPWNCFKLLSIM